MLINLSNYLYTHKTVQILCLTNYIIIRKIEFYFFI